MNNYENMLLDVMQQKDTAPNQDFYLNFANPNEQECFFARYGGREAIQREFPEFYRLALNTIEDACSASLCGESRSCITSRERGSLKDGVKIRDMVFSKELLGASGLVSLCKKSPRIYISLSLLKNGKLIKRERKFFHNVTNSVLYCTQSRGFSEAGQELTCVMNVTWQDPATNLLKDVSHILESSTLEEEIVKTVELYHPCLYHPCTDPDYKKKPGAKPMPALHKIEENATGKQPLDIPAKVDEPSKRTSINVCYARAPGGRDVSDYIYDEGREKSLQNVYLDIRGKVTLNSGYTFSSVDYFDIILDCVGDGTIDYSATPVKDVHYYATPEGFDFALPTYWKEQIPDSVVHGNRLYYLEADICFKCVETTEPVHISISSRVGISALEEHMAEIKPIRLFWGCLAEDTQIRMADGSCKPVQALCQGDMVYGPDGSDTVLDLIRGCDTDMYVIKAVGMKEICTTANHPFLTKSGWKLAGELFSADEIANGDGGYTAVEHHYPVSRETNVYNPILENNHLLCAEGYIVGDNEMQGKCVSQKYQSDNSVSIPEIEAECEKLKKMFG